MRVRLKGLNRVKTRLASGKEVIYYYAWKGGPRLPGTPGSPEFMAAYNAAVSARRETGIGTLQSIINAYGISSNFTALAPRTQADYRRQIKRIEGEYGDFPLAGLEDRRTRGEFLAWRDKLAVSSRRQADYAFAVLSIILAWGVDRGLATANPCERAGRVYRGSRNESVWTSADEAAFLDKAPPHLALALMLALWTGQRQGDLLRLTWTAYDGTHIRLTQRKTGARVVVPVGAPLRERLDATARKAATVLATEAGTAWTESGFRASWRKACIRAGVSGVTFHDLRGTAITRLALAGCEVPEIATSTGHSLRDVAAILDSHYLYRDTRLAESAINKMEQHAAGTKVPK